jgi:hypothetical protein
LLAVVVAVGACRSSKDRSALLDGVATVEHRLNTRIMPVPDLTIRVPEAMSDIEWDRHARFDNFFITNPGDTGEVQQGMIVINVSPSTMSFIADTVDVDEFIGTIAGQDVVWREYTVVGPDGSQLYQRETVQQELFAPFKAHPDQPAVLLQAFIVGSNYDLVEKLTASVETLTLVNEPDI